MNIILREFLRALRHRYCDSCFLWLFGGVKKYRLTAKESVQRIIPRIRSEFVRSILFTVGVLYLQRNLQNPTTLLIKFVPEIRIEQIVTWSAPFNVRRPRRLHRRDIQPLNIERRDPRYDFQCGSQDARNDHMSQLSKLKHLKISTARFPHAAHSENSYA